MRYQQPLLILTTLLLCSAMPSASRGHDTSRLAFLRARALAEAKADARAEQVDPSRPPAATCKLTINLLDPSSRQPIAGLTRITNLETGKAVKLTDEFHRALNWYAVAEQTTVRVPCAKVRIEALRGLDTERAQRDLDLTEVQTMQVDVPLRQFYDTRFRGLRAGNTHLHLMKLTHAEADRYLKVVPRADNLDLVFLSYLRRIPDERHYISNQIVENSFAGGDLQRLSQTGVLFANGQEHRHNFGPGGEGYGHVMLLDLQKLIRPVSIGPGIMKRGSDGIPLARGMRQARRDGATVIWCHNKFGFEDLPNWLSGLIHAQNIFDGGIHGSYEDTFYRYLNLGMRVPFSTGTDWFIYDFARAYVEVDGELTADRWLEGLRGGRSYITNGPFLELETEQGTIGDTLSLPEPGQITVQGRGMGRLDFKGLELVYNGQVVARTTAIAEGGHHYADLRHLLDVPESGWIALRIPLKAGKTELDQPLFAHTSPIYVEVGDQPIFRREVAEQLLGEIKHGMRVIQEKASFASPRERDAVLRVYRDAVVELERRLK